LWYSFAIKSRPDCVTETVTFCVLPAWLSIYLLASISTNKRIDNRAARLSSELRKRVKKGSVMLRVRERNWLSPVPTMLLNTTQHQTAHARHRDDDSGQSVTALYTHTASSPPAHHPPSLYSCRRCPHSGAQEQRGGAVSKLLGVPKLRSRMKWLSK